MKLMLNDPLTDNSQGHNWYETNTNYLNTLSSCSFGTGEYVDFTLVSSFCMTMETDFENFTYEVEMNITAGTCGGLVFRQDVSGRFYYVFYVWQNGSYFLDDQDANLIPARFSSAIRQGLYVTNVVAVVARGKLLDFYINHVMVVSIQVSNSSHGLVGVAAIRLALNIIPSSQTTVDYSNAKVWQL